MSTESEKCCFKIDVKRDDSRTDDPISLCLRSEQDGVFLCMRGKQQMLYDLLSSARWAVSRVEGNQWLYTDFDYDEFDLCMIPSEEFLQEKYASEKSFTHISEEMTIPEKEDDKEIQEPEKKCDDKKPDEKKSLPPPPPPPSSSTKVGYLVSVFLCHSCLSFLYSCHSPPKKSVTRFQSQKKFPLKRIHIETRKDDLLLRYDVLAPLMEEV